MKTAAIITTVIATFLFLYSSYMLTYDPIARTTKDGMLLFSFAVCYAVPSILWILYLITQKK